jgi:hypothetical protein
MGMKTNQRFENKRLFMEQVKYLEGKFRINDGEYVREDDPRRKPKEHTKHCGERFTE